MEETNEAQEVLKEASENNFKKAFRKNKMDIAFKIANHFIDQYHIITIGGKRECELFIYEDGIYVPGENKIKRKIQEMLEELLNTYYRNEIINKIKNLTVAERDSYWVDEKFINLKNGLFNIETEEFKPHDPQYVFFTKLPINYNPEAECPAIKKFLSEILDEKDIPIIQEWFGYALYRRYFIKKAIIFVGEGNTGKTTLISLHYAFVGKNNVSGVSLQKISSDKFSAAHLYNKHINLCDELSLKDVNNNEIFKIATGGGIITGEKKFGNQFQFENFSKLTFACNRIPDVKDSNDDAYFSRWIVIQFNKTIREDQQDKHLIKKIITQEELSGLLNFSLKGLKRLLKNGKFSYDKEPYEVKTEMLRSGSAIAQFASNCLEEKAGEWVSKQEMYEKFIKYANSLKLPPATIMDFGKKIRNYAYYIADGKKLGCGPQTNKKTQITGWKNVIVKTADDFSEEEKLDSEKNSNETSER